jgi:hypothetical protein
VFHAEFDPPLSYRPTKHNVASPAIALGCSQSL